MSLTRHRAAVSVGLTVAVVLAVLAAAGLYAWERQQAAESALADIEPRYARLLGLQKSDVPLKKAVLGAFEGLRRWAYPADQDSGKAGNDVQQRARRAAEVGGMNIVSSQILPPRMDGGLEQIPVSLTLEGPVQSLQATLANMTGDRPAIFVESLGLRAIDKGDPKQPQQVSANLIVLSLRMQP